MIQPRELSWIECANILVQHSDLEGDETYNFNKFLLYEPQPGQTVNDYLNQMRILFMSIMDHHNKMVTLKEKVKGALRRDFPALLAPEKENLRRLSSPSFYFTYVFQVFGHLTFPGEPINQSSFDIHALQRYPTKRYPKRDQRDNSHNNQRYYKQNQGYSTDQHGYSKGNKKSHSFKNQKYQNKPNGQQKFNKGYYYHSNNRYYRIKGEWDGQTPRFEKVTYRRESDDGTTINVIEVFEPVNEEEVDGNTESEDEGETGINIMEINDRFEEVDSSDEESSTDSDVNYDVYEMDSGAEANFIDEELLWLYPGYKKFALKKPIIAKSALRGTQKVTFAAKINLPKPFRCTLTFYVLPNLEKIIIGKPTLRKWKYQTTENGDHLDIEGRSFTIANLELEESNLHKLRKNLESDLLANFPQLFATEPRPPKERTFKYDIRTTDEIPVLSPAYFATPEEKK
ncbi:uncharacterized protein J8A68_002278 [[Candida] subhashii]|uniref:Uncharacterized protein n=1 Tax=[Candida] subhashii TaxID=561895 RepID=A0A8J5QPK3_9ASCO|nr:uncharacterized protein J8A68_002278 [[Candida] subhashii]KAG7664215.1 hypothetical protein J8A68_002278 [[Candida] subhashii]